MRKKYPKYIAAYDGEWDEEVKKIPSKTTYYVLRQIPQDSSLPIGFSLKGNYISWYNKYKLCSQGTLEDEIYNWAKYKEVEKEEFALLI